jgi:hypothetical protein
MQVANGTCSRGLDKSAPGKLFVITRDARMLYVAEKMWSIATKTSAPSVPSLVLITVELFLPSFLGSPPSSAFLSHRKVKKPERSEPDKEGSNEGPSEARAGGSCHWQRSITRGCGHIRRPERSEPQGLAQNPLEKRERMKEENISSLLANPSPPGSLSSNFVLIVPLYNH